MVFTKVSSDPNVKLILEIACKGKGTRSTLNSPKGIKFQWEPNETSR